jgi:hypothetical protein
MNLTDRGTVPTLALTVAAALTLAACRGDSTITQSRSRTATGASASAPTPPPDFVTEVLVNGNASGQVVTLTPAAARDALSAGFLTDQRTRLGIDSLWSLPSSEGLDGAYAAHGWVGWQVALADPAAPTSVTVARCAR